MKKLRIAQVAPCWLAIPPRKYGGIERIVHYLTEELVRRGHHVTLFTSGDSKTSARLIPVYRKSLVKLGIPWSENILNIESIAAASRMAKDFDIIHSHIDHLSLFFDGVVTTPMVLTLHNPMHSEGGEVSSKLLLYERHNKKIKAVFISKQQRDNSFVKFKKSDVVYNGIDISKFQFRSQPENYFAWVGRLDPYKGVENAIQIAKQAGVKLLLAGKIDPGRERYFKEKIKPHLSKKIQYLGEFTQKELAQLYGGARALLYPITWEEPFGLVMVEAMACGTPVLAFNRGSVSEIVSHGETGFVEDTKQGLARAIKTVDTLDRSKCRSRVEKFFTVKKMVDGYEQVYTQLLKR